MNEICLRYITDENQRIWFCEKISGHDGWHSTYWSNGFATMSWENQDD